MEFDECRANLPLMPPSHTHSARQHPIPIPKSEQPDQCSRWVPQKSEWILASPFIDSVSATFRWLLLEWIDRDSVRNPSRSRACQS
ncbi:hypothetical protein NPIL_36221 [Nephila pilipes]|uniref:Uncharacterized protein n=1 Tax=Nephila pilipes TaxID=299642 RepID=A0A8X6MWA7_NEPPI|nr:hypothetical protein NPIL_36221 [Nephila pilipes]